MTKILIEKGTVITVSSANDVLQPGYVAIENDRITAVAAGKAPGLLRDQVDQVIDASGFAVMPGLINAHAHMHECFIRGLSDDRNVIHRLDEVYLPVFTHMNENDVYLASMVGLIENIRGGAAAVTSQMGPNGHASIADAICRAASEIGIRFKFARSCADRRRPEPHREQPDRILSEMERLYGTWHGKASRRIRIDFGPVTHYNCSGDTLLRCFELAEEWGIGIHMHVAESREEVDLHVEETGKRCVEWLYDLGVLGPHFQLAHSVWLDDREIEFLAETGAVVVHCPVSNMFIGAGIAPVLSMRRAGVHVALATDGQSCNNGQEMLDILKWTVDLHKVSSLDATALTPEDVIHMAYRGGAVAFGQPHELGSLEVGSKADLILVDMTNSRMMPAVSAQSALVNYTRSDDVDTVIVDGKILMQNRRITVVDEESILREARAARDVLLERADVHLR